MTCPPPKQHLLSMVSFPFILKTNPALIQHILQQNRPRNPTCCWRTMLLRMSFQYPLGPWPSGRMYWMNCFPSMRMLANPRSPTKWSPHHHNLDHRWHQTLQRLHAPAIYNHHLISRIARILLPLLHGHQWLCLTIILMGSLVLIHLLMVIWATVIITCHHPLTAPKGTPIIIPQIRQFSHLMVQVPLTNMDLGVSIQRGRCPATNICTPNVTPTFLTNTHMLNATLVPFCMVMHDMIILAPTTILPTIATPTVIPWEPIHHRLPCMHLILVWGQTSHQRGWTIIPLQTQISQDRQGWITRMGVLKRVDEMEEPW